MLIRLVFLADSPAVATFSLVFPRPAPGNRGAGEKARTSAVHP
jgi:hypothetical protein